MGGTTTFGLSDPAQGSERVLLRRLLLLGLSLLAFFWLDAVMTSASASGTGDVGASHSDEVVATVDDQAAAVVGSGHDVVEGLAPVERVTTAAHDAASAASPAAQPVVDAVDRVVDAVEPAAQPVVDAVAPVVDAAKPAAQPVVDAVARGDEVPAAESGDASDQGSAIEPGASPSGSATASARPGVSAVPGVATPALSTIGVQRSGATRARPTARAFDCTSSPVCSSASADRGGSAPSRPLSPVPTDPAGGCGTPPELRNASAPTNSPLPVASNTWIPDVVRLGDVGSGVTPLSTTSPRPGQRPG